MKKKLAMMAVSAAFVVSALGAGCKQLSPNGMADAATQDLGIPVFLWAMGDDVCANRQLKVLFDEFARNNATGRSALAARIKSTYKAVVVLATKDLGDTTGQLKVLQLQDNRRHVLDYKTFIDSRDNTEHRSAGTVIDRGDADSVEGRVLSLRPNRSEDKSEKQLYVTMDAAAFTSMTSTIPAETLSFEDAITQQKVWLVQRGYTDADLCGKLMKFADLF